MMYAYSVSTTRSVVVAVLALALVMSGQRAHAQPGWVLSHHKISDTEGGFKGILVDTDWFGASTMVALGDLGGDGCVEPPLGLVSWWPGDGTAADVQDGNSGTLQNGTGFAPGMVGEAFSLDGIDDRVAITDAENLRITGNLTIEAWIQIGSFPGSGHGQIVFRGDDRPGLDPYYLSTQPQGRVRFHVGSLTNEEDLEVPVVIGNLVHIAATLNDRTGSMSIYLNGELAAQVFTTVRPFENLDPDFNPGIGIGNHADSRVHNQPFHGLIDELEIYDRALSLAEIQAIFNAGSAGKCKPCPWDLDANGSVGVKDLLILLGAWGPCPPKGDCLADFDLSGEIDVKDLLFLLGAWGPCP